MKRFFSWCVENGWLDQSPAKPLKSPKVGETDVVPFSEEEIDKILKACKAYKGPNRDRLVVLTDLMLATGLAIGDASTISKERIVKNSTHWYVELRRAKTGTAVSCPIPNDLAKAITGLDSDTPFWSGASDLEDITKNWRKAYGKVFKAAGVDGHPHQFRHTAAKRLLLAGLPVSHVATLLANSEAIVRKHYSKWIPERQAAFDSANWGHLDRLKNGTFTVRQKSDIANTRINIGDLWRGRVEVESTTRSAKERVAGFEGREGHRTPFAPIPH